MLYMIFQYENQFQSCGSEAILKNLTWPSSKDSRTARFSYPVETVLMVCLVVETVLTKVKILTGLALEPGQWIYYYLDVTPDFHVL